MVKTCSVRTAPESRRPELQAQHGHDRQQSVAQRVPDHDHEAVRPLGAGGAHEVLLQHLEHRGAHLTHEHRGQPRAQHERGHEHALQVLDGASEKGT
jgi:hypothetical protein